MQYWTIENNIIVCYRLHLCLLFFQIMKDNSNLLFLWQAVTYKHIPNSWYFYSPQIKIELNKEQAKRTRISCFRLFDMPRYKSYISESQYASALFSNKERIDSSCIKLSKI